MMPEKKIAIIIHSEDEQYTEECLAYVELLEIPEGYAIELFVVTESESMVNSYNEAMKASDAKYKLYLSEKTFILQRDFIARCIDIFEADCSIGMLGVLGGRGKCGEKITSYNVGKAILSNGDTTELVDFQTERTDYYLVDYLDSALLFTQHDIPWCEEILEQGKCNWDAGFKVMIPYQEVAWCQIDRGELHGGTEEARQLYNYFKFGLRRIQYQLGEEQTEDIYKDYEDGFISAEIVEAILRRDILYSRRVEHMLLTHSRKQRLNGTVDVQDKEMNIISSLNRKYVPQVCVMLESLYANHKDVEIHVYLLHSELLEQDFQVIREHAQRWGARVEFLEIDERKFEKLPTTELWTKEALYRLEMMEVLPSCVDRALYLDVDVLILRPIYELYFADFDGMDLIAGKDMGSQMPFGDVRDTIFEEALCQKDFAYVCSGVLVWNVEKLRNDVSLSTYLKVAETLNYHLLAPDQDLINYVHTGKMKLVDEYRYGCFVKGYHWSLDEIRRCVSILHYAGATKPWSGRFPKVEAYKVWWQYAKNTPLYVQMLEQCFEESYETDRKMYAAVKKIVTNGGGSNAGDSDSRAKGS